MNDCIEFRGGIAGSGYGYLYVAGRQWLAHRFAWFCHHGEIPKDMFVLHKCDNRRCINPAHLFLGTHADNMADMVAKGRAWSPKLRGEANGSAKLTEKQIRQIRATHALGDVTHQQLAEKYGVSCAHVGKIIRRKKWAHVQ